ncbi:hypothetical protein N7509_001530 [Penicillium cosmopolitanum]|uniref:Uncharacterized protein n=1 Tax=Penicillium cosmopolitanum TaxID=1131564 RepID=A0A9W9W794_9EURO|nr:uncharacterized protein N7509_001530 [Penicillium cosmopolitanum]KAJ5407647.1 hypothetical protein N7509_001530 [Penicillium cosmopolitanum]
MAEGRATGPFSPFVNLGLDLTREEVVDAIFEAARNNPSGNPLTLTIGGSQLLVLCSRKYQLELCYKLGRDVHHIPGRMTREQWLSTDPAYIDALLIQSRGLPLVESCTDWLRNLGPFPRCVRLPGHYGGICGNCRYDKRDKECTLRWHGGGNRTTCAWESVIATQPLSDSEPSSSSFGLLSSPRTEYSLGSSQSSAIVIEGSPRYSQFGSSPPSSQHLRHRGNTPKSSSIRPPTVSPQPSYAIAVEIPLPSSIEEPAGSSTFNPILITESDSGDKADSGDEDTDDDMDMDIDEDYIIYLPDSKEDDPDYIESSDSSEEEGCEEIPHPEQTIDEDSDETW